MKIYNTLTRQKEEFIPLDGNKVKMYACGITVSGEAHIGHAFQALIYDVMRKYLEKKGYSVTYARNYTDVDDKIIAKSRETGIPADVYAADMIRKIDAEMHRFQVDDPTVWLKATGNIENIVDFISRLIEKGHAYATEKGDVYFSVESFPAYGQLSNRNLEDAISGVRIDSDENKRNALDFALWKSAKEGEICWDSPWGKGRPGWHIECSAMNRAAFGDQIDLHGGGRDLIFPHHENEIAQTEGLLGHPAARFWMHGEFMLVNGGKMSKSLGNVYLLQDIVDRGYDPLVYKLFCYSIQYRKKLNFTWEGMDSAKIALDRLREAYQKHLTGTEDVAEELISKYEKDFNEAINDDLNMPVAMSVVWEVAKRTEKSKKLAELLKKFDRVLGIKIDEHKEEEIPDDIKELLTKRAEARKNKDWAESDKIRDIIKEKGYIVKDSKEGQTVEKI